MKVNPIGKSRKEVLIIPYYYYTHYSIFCDLYDQIIKNEWNPSFVSIKGNKELDTINFPYVQKLNETKKKVININLLPTNEKSTLLEKASRLISIFRNFRRLKLFIKEAKPEIIILGTDLGGIYIRRIQDIAKNRKIKICIFQNTLFLPTLYRKDIAPQYPFYILQFLWICGLKRTFAFSSDIPGTYIQNSYVFPLGKKSLKIIADTGKAPNYIHMAINSSVDLNPQYTSQKRQQIVNSFFNANKLCREDILLTYFTETLQEVHGIEYLKSMNEMLYAVFNKLPSNFRVIIKFHPRETQEIISHFKNTFIGKRYLFFEDIAPNELIISSHISIAKCSAVLINSILLKTPILSINTIQSNNELIIPFPESFICNDSKTILDLITSITNRNENSIIQTNKIIEEWIITNFENNIQGQASKKAIDILNEIC